MWPVSFWPPKSGSESMMWIRIRIRIQKTVKIMGNSYKNRQKWPEYHIKKRNTHNYYLTHMNNNFIKIIMFIFLEHYNLYGKKKFFWKLTFVNAIYDRLLQANICRSGDTFISLGGGSCCPCAWAASPPPTSSSSTSGTYRVMQSDRNSFCWDVFLTTLPWHILVG